MAETIGLVIGWFGAIIGFFTTLYQFRRAKRAEVGAKEVATADQMVELVKKSFEEALELAKKEKADLADQIEALRNENDENRKDNRKLRRAISRLERASEAIMVCNHRDDCPVLARLHGSPDSAGVTLDADAGQRAHCRDPA